MTSIEERLQLLERKVFHLRDPNSPIPGDLDGLGFIVKPIVCIFIGIVVLGAIGSLYEYCFPIKKTSN
jgi:hypothetical protein